MPKPTPTLDHWINTPQGQYVLTWVQQQCDLRVVDIFGFHALQLGLSGCNLLATNRIPLQQIIANHPNHANHTLPGAVNCLADYAHLPIKNQSIDLLVLPFVLDFAPNPHQVLREVERVLRPEGQLLIFGFNPWSWWGLHKRAQQGWAKLRNQTPPIPWHGHYLSSPRLRDWLKLLSFDAHRTQYACFIPPCESANAWLRLRFLDTIGESVWPFFGGVYHIHAIKRVAGMRLIQPWAAKPHAKAALSASLPRVIQKDSSDV